MHPAVKNERENETDMTIYPLEFHRRCERKWERRAGLLRAFESSAQPDGSVPSYRTQGTKRPRVVRAQTLAAEPPAPNEVRSSRRDVSCDPPAPTGTAGRLLAPWTAIGRRSLGDVRVA